MLRFPGAIVLGALTLGLCMPASADMPTPVLQFDGAQQITVAGKPAVRYRVSVVNRGSYNPDLFKSAPFLKACGKNTKASRTYAYIFNNDPPPPGGVPALNTFCALKSPDDLGTLWLVRAKSLPQPSGVYLTLRDRITKELATSQPVPVHFP